MLWWVLGACSEEPGGTGIIRDDPSGTDTSTGPDDTGLPASDTGEVPDPPVLDGLCARSAGNPLRIECTATLEEAGPATLTLSAPGLPTRTFRSEEVQVEHTIVGWGLKPDTTWDWVLGGQSGQVATGPLHPELAAGLDVTVEGDPGALGFDAILQPLECAGMWMVMLDRDGDVVWYEPTALYGGRQDGYEWSQADRSVLTLGDGQLLEVHVSGAERLRLERSVHFEAGLHHDVSRWGPYTYLLFEERVGSLNVDGFYVFEGATQLGRFFLGDHYAVPGTGMGDWSHANTLNATDDGEIVLSLLEFDTVLGVDGDPGSPTFLGLRWSAAGTADGLPGPTYTAPDGPREGFDGQHDAQRHGDQLVLFDNAGVGGGSRAARYDLDAAAGEVRLDADWEIPESCPVQGGAIPVDGGIVVTCSNSETVRAFEEDGAAPVWTLTARCTGDTPTMIRGIPVLVE